MEPKRWGLENCMMLQDDCGQFIDIEDYERMESDLRRQLEEAKASIGLHCTCGNSEFKCLVCEMHVNTFQTKTLIDKIYAREEKLKEQLAEVTAERDLFSRQTAVLWKAVRAMQDLIDQSQGVYGLHLNGDGAPWETLQKGGQFEEWLLDFDDALESADDEAQAALQREE